MCYPSFYAWKNSFWPVFQPKIKLELYEKYRYRPFLKEFEAYNEEEKEYIEFIQGKNTEIMKKRGFPTRRNSFYRGYNYYPCFNPGVKMLAKEDLEKLDRWENG